MVATPIGNLQDITLRAIATLKKVDTILCEDTRVTSKLLQHYDIDIPTMSYHHHSSDDKKLQILKMLQEGSSLALVTDAGTPGISDPGNELVDFLLQADASIQVIPIPGPSSLTTALSASGFRADKFVFIGFMPKKKKTKLLAFLKETKYTFVFFESPYRVVKTFEGMVRDFGDRNIFVARELTKLHEETYRGNLADVTALLKGKKIKGEVVVVVNGI